MEDLGSGEDGAGAWPVPKTLEAQLQGRVYDACGWAVGAPVELS